MAVDRSEFMGLNTDDPPDRNGNNAFYSMNVLPGSKTTVKPRFGVSKVAHYKTDTLGRAIIADGLPGNLGGGIMLVFVNKTGAGADAIRVDAIGVFKPAVVASAYNTVDGVDET